ncbi:serine O-acetyltransferase [Priestia flexa]|uniref:serine O-acetyltransferase n=1 Tax=Priestia flexa TaxID=86664 RepID=UPI002891B082|nr:serine O-acetyltransferase [Priestia flexa]MDT2047779.1 serine O-acetyltransferase [Priestia flexa]
MKEGAFLKYIRVYQFFWKKRLKFFAKLMMLFGRILFSCDIPPSCTIGKNTSFPHYGLGVVIHPRCKIGDNCKLYQNVTIGSRNGQGPPVIGNNVLVESGAVILGDIKIGDNVNIGSNSVIINNVPSNSTVVGVPGRVLKNKI